MGEPDYQRGMTAIGWLLVLGLIALFAIVIIRLAPIYYEYYTIRTAVANVAADPAHKSTSDLYHELERRFEVNNINIISPRDVKLARQGRQRSFVLDYQEHTHFLANIDFLVTFQHRFNIDHD